MDMAGALAPCGEIGLPGGVLLSDVPQRSNGLKERLGPKSSLKHRIGAGSARQALLLGAVDQHEAAHPWPAAFDLSQRLTVLFFDQAAVEQDQCGCFFGDLQHGIPSIAGETDDGDTFTRAQQHAQTISQTSWGRDDERWDAILHRAHHYPKVTVNGNRFILI
jgi:hypothetical protein